MRFKVLLSMALLVCGTGCGGGGGNTSSGDGGGSEDVSGGGPVYVGGECSSFLDCTEPAWPHCDTALGRCVLCSLDSHCASGTCDTQTHACGSAKPDAGVATDAGAPDAEALHDAGRDAGASDAGHPPADGGHDGGIPVDCTGVTCSDAGVCSMDGGKPECICGEGHFPIPGEFLCAEDNACGGCSGHGACKIWDAVNVCACDKGYTPSDNAGRDCVPTWAACRGGAFSWDWNDDGTTETTLEPSANECFMFELINRTRATHDPQGTSECHTPLVYSIEWSAHARNHSKKMLDQGRLFHADFNHSQNCASGCDVECEMYLYMYGAGEDHCPAESHHCGIMECGITHVGVGNFPPEDGTYNTQNFY
jgi:hypothetical protein